MTGRITDRLKNMFKMLKTAWITVWLVVVALLLAVTTTYAAYTGVTTSKRVISLSDRDDMLFSSRYLFANGSELQRVGFAKSETDPKITIDICNYDKNGLGKYSKDIEFILEARLINYDGTVLSGTTVTSDKYRIAYLDGTTESTTYVLTSLTNEWQELKELKDGDENSEENNGESSEGNKIFTLTGGTKTSLKFVLHCDPATLANPLYAVEVRATPTPKENYDDLKSISGRMRAVSRSSQNLEWSGEFTDRLINADPKNFDAYNYVISGIGKGKITLTYNSELLELDKNDLTLLSNVSGYNNTPADGKTVITFKVDTTVDDAVSRYVIHFYQKTGEPIKAFSEEYVKTEFDGD